MPTGEDNANVAELLVRAAASRGDAPAIVGPTGQEGWSFAALAEAGSRLGAAIRELGVGPGDRVLVLEPHPRRRYAVVAGVLWAGAGLIVPPGSLPAWQAITVAAGAGPRLVIFGPRLWPIVVAHPALREVRLRATAIGPRLPGSVILDGFGIPAGPVRVPRDAVALASFTTGSTGRPKLVLRSHGVLRAQDRALGRLRDLSAEDRDLAGLPLLVLHNLGSGVTSVLPPPESRSTRHGRAVLETIAAARVTSAVGFPHLFEAAASGRVGSDEALRGLRSIQLGGTRVPGELLAALGRLASEARIDVVYGCTEVEPIASIGAEEYLAELAAADPASGVCVGRPVDGLELAIDPIPGITAVGSERPVGAVRVRGPHAAAPGDAWVAPGDVGWIDADQRLWLLGRAASAVDGLLPYPVELAVERLAGVRRAVLVRLDDGGGARAAVAAEPCSDSVASRRACRRTIGAMSRERQWPVAGLVVGRLPTVRGPSGKVDVRRLARTGARSCRATSPPSRSGHR